MAGPTRQQAARLAKELDETAELMTDFLRARDWESPFGSETQLKSTRQKLKEAASKMRGNPSQSDYDRAMRLYKDINGLR